jgi:hypothetical protein
VKEATMSGSFFFPTTGIRVRPATLLAIDDHSLPLRKHLQCYITKPKVRPEPVLVPGRDHVDRPDHISTFFYGTVLHEEDRFRMWYYASHLAAERAGFLEEGPVCYAESEDGLHWVKPNLGLVTWRGNRDNNIVAVPELYTEAAHVIRDDDDPDPQHRYKIVYNYRPGTNWTIRTATSPDGLRWQAGPDQPYDEFIEHASFYRYDGLYYVNGQMKQWGESGHRIGRQAYAILSVDFEHWLPAVGESFALPEPRNPEDRGFDKRYDQVHIGVGAAPFGNVLVGLYCIWHNEPYPTAGDWFGMGTTSGDFGLVVSNDGLHFREPVKGHVWLHRDESPLSLVPPGKVETIMTQGNGILNVGDETRIYHGRWANSDREDTYYAEVALATLPRDRWGCLGLWDDQAEGSIWTCPVTLPEGGTQVALNADCAQGMTVEVLDAQFKPLPDFAGANAGRTQAEGGLDCAVIWPAGGLERLSGQTVRFRIALERTRAGDPRLYALYLR